MSPSLIPEKPLQVSPSLATTIGLEEATLLAVLGELLLHRETQHKNGYQWLQLSEDCLTRFLPFWTDHDIQRISKSLRDKGVVLLDSAPYTSSRVLHIALNESSAGYQAPQREHQPAAPAPASFQAQPQAQPQAQRAHNSTSRGANLIAPNWQPSDDLIRQISQHNIDVNFVRQQLPEFITYWRERGEAHHSWGSKFLRHIVHKWRDHESDFSRRDQEVTMVAHWRPTADALEVLIKHAEIRLEFVEDTIPEFVLYWQERGIKARTWNTKFIQHVKRQWASFNSAIEHDPNPKRITEDWQPSNDVYDVLRLANIDIDFSQQLVPEFVLYWQDSNQLHNSWNTKFLQHAKFHWAKRHSLNTSGKVLSTAQAKNHAGQQSAYQSGRTRDQGLVEHLTDRSWAS